MYIFKKTRNKYAKILTVVNCEWKAYRQFECYIIFLIILFNAIPLHPNSKIKSKARKQKPKKYIILSTAKIAWYEIYHSTYGSIIWNYENKWILCLFYIPITFFKLLNKKKITIFSNPLTIQLSWEPSKTLTFQNCSHY